MVESEADRDPTVYQAAEPAPPSPDERRSGESPPAPPHAKPPRDASRRGPLPLFFILALAALGLARAINVGYLSDDFAIIDYVSRHGNTAAWTGPWLGGEHMLFHRPLATALYDLEYRAFGVDPLPAHLLHALWHLLATALVFGIIRRLGGTRPAAALGALLFAWHPYLGVASSWIAARSGTVAGTLTLLTIHAWLGWRSQSGLRRYASGGLALLAAAAATLTRESGYLALVAPFTIDLCMGEPSPRWRRLFTRHLLFMLAGAGLLALRRHSLGTFFGGYPQNSGIVGGGSILDAFATFGNALLDLLRGLPGDHIPPWIAASAPGGLRKWVGDQLAWPTACAGLLLLFLLASILYRIWAGPGKKGTAPRGVLSTLLALFFTQGLLLLLTGPLLAPSTGQRWYAGIAIFCIFVASALAPLLRRPFIWMPLVLVLAYGCGLWLVQSEVIAADTISRRFYKRVGTELDALPPEAEMVFLTRLPESHRGVPLFHWGVSSALRPPFRPAPPPRPIYPVHRFMELGSFGFQPPYMHAPVEALLYAAGRKPWVYSLPETLRGDEEPFPLTLITPATQAEGLGPPPAALGKIQALFADPPLKVLSPLENRVRLEKGRSPLLRVAVGTRRLSNVVFHCFLPVADAQHRVQVAGERMEVDLWPVLGDYIRFHEEPCTLYVIPIGQAPEAEGGRLHLGALVTFEIGMDQR